LLEDILIKTYYGNTIKQWSIALFIILGVAIAAKILYKLTSGAIKAFTKKTKTKFDDILIDMIEEPLIFTLVLVGIWYSLKTLSFTEASQVVIDNGFQFVIVMNVVWFLSRLFDAIYEEYMIPMAEKSESDMDDQIFPILKKGIKGILWILGIIVGLNNAGYDVGALLAGLGIGGLALAMAAKDSVSNIFGGLTIFSDKLFKIKDKISVSGIEGVVEDIGIRSTKIRKYDGRIVTIPNGKFTNDKVENVSSEPSRKVSTTIGISCDTSVADVKKAMKLIEKILEKNEGLLAKHFVNLSGFGDFTFDISVIYYIKKSANIGGTKTEVNLAILDQFNKNKIEMPFPTQTILTKKG
jgi:MscS family membrane protein